MRIEVCGPGCAKCHMTLDAVRKAVKELGLEGAVELTEEKDIMAIIKKGVFLTPAVIVDGVKVSEGRIPKAQEIRSWIEER
jgi:small redox-active disulfide protein 2